MIPVLMPANVSPSTMHLNGYGFLKDCISCKVTEELNRTYEAELTVPYDSIRTVQVGIYEVPVEPDMCLKLKAGDGRENQLFRIYRITKPLNGIVKIYAQHISYDLALNPVENINLSNVTAATALSGVLAAGYYNHNFIYNTDKTTVSSLNISTPHSIREILGGIDGSILDNFGGEYEFDNFKVNLWTARGSNTGVTIYYGKNLTDFTSDINIQNTYTGVFPFAEFEGSVVTIPQKIITTDNFNAYSEPRILVLDLSDKFEELPTYQQVKDAAVNYVNNNNIDSIYQNLKINFVQLWNTEEYKNMAGLEKVDIGDTITIRYYKLGINAQAKVVKTVYNSLTEQYESVEIGTPKNKWGKVIK